MSAQDVFVQLFTRLFAHYQESLNPAARSSNAVNCESGEAAPPAERDRLIAAGRLALMELESEEDTRDRRWYAQPGQAEWGC